MTDEAWSRDRLAKLKAMAPARRRTPKSFAKVDLVGAARAFKAMHCTKAIVWIWLLHRAWRHNSRTIAVPNAELVRLGVSPDTKMRALRLLEREGLLTLGPRSRKTPIVTLL